ncbi:MAG TPA: FAD binding domain-containing protein [Verrucomicrobiae bacterium]|nr:FAD binding domain-containing protein [Verrucomicrobiae bacterium]
MLPSFKLLQPTTIAEAAGELRRLGDTARLYAGGAELALLMRHGLVEPEYLIDIKGIAELNRIEEKGNALILGACATHHRLARDSLVRERLPAFAYAESQVANVRVRAQGTLGGNLCFNDPHSDPGTALLIHEAEVTVADGNSSRQIALEDFLGEMYATALAPDELLVRVEVPRLAEGWSSAYLRVHRYQRPTLGVGAAVKFTSGRIDDIRLAVGCVSPRPLRLRDLERDLRGADLKSAKEIIQGRKDDLRELLQPVDDLLGSAAYKLYMTQVLLGRALEQAADKSFTFESSTFKSKETAALPKTKIRNLEPRTHVNLSLTINGKAWQGTVPVEQTLLEFLRQRLELTGTKRSCESEVCGACTVVVDGLPVSSCSYLAFEADGKSVTTVEGLAQGEALDPLQQGFIRHLGAQCGYCTPGQLMAAKSLLLENPSPGREEIAEWLRGNICRCGAYVGIEAAIREASGQTTTGER